MPASQSYPIPGEPQRSAPGGAQVSPRRAHDLALQTIPTRDLIAEIETSRWLALDVADAPGDSRAVAEIQLESLVAELERRKRLWERSTDDPLRPAWPRRDMDLKARVEAVKACWRIDRFCRELLGCDLRPGGRDRLKARCPLPGHDDRTASFTVYGVSDSAWCFGCQRGGDVIALTGSMFGLERFYDCLTRLEAEAGSRGVA